MAWLLNSFAWKSRMEGSLSFSNLRQPLSSSRRWAFQTSWLSKSANGLPGVPGSPARNRPASLASRPRGAPSGTTGIVAATALFPQNVGAFREKQVRRDQVMVPENRRPNAIGFRCNPFDSDAGVDDQTLA